MSQTAETTATVETAPLRTLPSQWGAAWTRFWFTPSDAIVLSLLRILIGVVALWWYLSLIPDLQRWFGPSGIFPLAIARDIRNSSDGFAISPLDLIDSAAQLWLAYGIGLAAIVLMIVGLFSRVTTILSLLFVLSFIHRAPMLSRPVDNILALAMFYLCLGPTGANFSIDSLLRKRRMLNRPSADPAQFSAIQYSSAATVAMRLMQVHLSLVYLAMAIAQLQWPIWWQGTAVWWMMARPESRLVDLTGLSGLGEKPFDYLVNFLTHAIVVYELCFAVFIWRPLVRPLLLVAGVFVWLGLALIGGSPIFAVLMLFATLAFLSPQRLRGWCFAGQ
ncbi:MAG TPA: hypothetical protein VGJ15_08440 [Pirellulales bacterium]|jgi:hypothetical protein